jgi:hypothetical protein
MMARASAGRFSRRHVARVNSRAARSIFLLRSPPVVEVRCTLKMEAILVSEFEPADLAVPDRRAAVEILDDDAAALTPTSTRKSEREGLPPGYRMRADAHYVEQLTARRSERASDQARTNGSGADSTAEAEGVEREHRRERILSQIAEHLATVASAASLLAGPASPLARRLNVDLIRAEAGRANWLLRTRALLDGTQRVQVRPYRLGAILDEIRQGFGPFCRVDNITLQLRAQDWDAMVAVDPVALVAGLTGALVATASLFDTADGAIVRVTTEASAGELRTIEVSQDEVAVPAQTSLRFFDVNWTDRPGGWLAALGAATARAVAQQHGGNAVLLVDERRGTSVRMNIGLRLP